MVFQVQNDATKQIVYIYNQVRIAECLAERYQAQDLLSLVRLGQGFEPTTWHA